MSVKGLDSKAAEALKEFGRKNRPEIASYLSEISQLDGPAGGNRQIVIQRGATRSQTTPEQRTAALFASQGLPSISDEEEPTDPAESLPEPLRKLDIFDNIDEERVLDFEEHCAEAKENSNYYDFKNKSKKANPAKFATCNGVSSAEDGKRVIS
mmetsp:Transcript_10182/g.22530  ORF Transcript_10182/g.22530 Transcript_10182/m.22530 type:complete len:154 (+) Transcript_10182:162-623(+)|eukprot:CAMPEP_0206492112 /NCGR_PEP_ID=MMETSP0324_2-20121206/45719_1 /ASSEMBLY_ACC=CAM_ASM_000836 /TAXON_ID=2866 /ORGANISM="Crypthecodinium cohnii, Strain Seligo" /LENGTH=153 /DNA_ID=CAMNT_0053974075 /DNA_START=67 /DNA_END=528 /DNA_ORIENTATION=-